LVSGFWLQPTAIWFRVFGFGNSKLETLNSKLNKMEQIRRFFSKFSKEQLIAFEKLMPLYSDWNSKINVISRKDIENLYERHVLHSLAIARAIKFPEKSEILDIGTGGGFPGIPLAIAFPDCKFTLLDAIGKKIKVVKAVYEALNLKNVTAIHGNVIELKPKFNFIVGRGVCAFPEFVNLSKKNIKHESAFPHNGILYLKGGDLKEELSSFKNKVKVEDISKWFPLEFFETKKIIYLPL